MKKTIKTLALLIAILSVLTSCIKEPIVSGRQDLVMSNLTIAIPSLISFGATEQENEVQSVRMIAMDDSKQVIFNGVSNIIIDFNTEKRCVFKNILSSAKTIFIICNEKVSMTATLDAVSSIQDLEEIQVSSDNSTRLPFVMFGKAIDVTLTPNGDKFKVTYSIPNGVGETDADLLNIPVKRLAVKVSMALIKKINSNDPKFTLSDFSVTIQRIPHLSFLCEDHMCNPSADHYFTPVSLPENSALVSDNDYTSDYKIAHPSNDHIQMEDIYIPEHLLQDLNNKNIATYVEIRAKATLPGNGNITQDVVYRFQLHSDKEGYKYQNPRNTWYKVYATVSSLGETGIFAYIVPMAEHEITVGWAALDGLVIVGDKISDAGKNRDIWGDPETYAGVLKVRKKVNGANVYSNVVFKYGSTVAVSSSGENGANYIPNTAEKMNDILWAPTTTLYPEWSNIPYITGNANIGANTKTDVLAGKGDPCKLVGLTKEQIAAGIVDNKQWHMASATEMGWLVDENDTYYRPNATVSADGYRTYHTYQIANNKYRTNDGVLVDNVSKGYFWTSTAAKHYEHTANGLRTGNNAEIFANDQDQNAYSVRCIRNKIPEPMLSVPTTVTLNYRSVDENNTLISTSLPFWKAELLTADDKKGTGEIDQFTLTRNSSVDSKLGNPYIVWGTASDNKFYYKLTRWETYSTSRTYNIRFWGRGFNGAILEYYSTIIQNGYKWNPITENRFGLPNSIPQQGATYDTGTIIIYSSTGGSHHTDTQLPDGVKVKVTVHHSGNIYLTETDWMEYSDDWPRKPTYLGFSLTIPPNNSPNSRVLTVTLLTQNLPGNPIYIINTNIVQQAQ